VNEAQLSRRRHSRQMKTKTGECVGSTLVRFQNKNIAELFVVVVMRTTFLRKPEAQEEDQREAWAIGRKRHRKKLLRCCLGKAFFLTWKLSINNLSVHSVTLMFAAAASIFYCFIHISNQLQKLWRRRRRFTQNRN